ncbi:MAG: TfoX/Sxy family protein [Bacteroidales bacterium]|nr:TfoX/Sxy family protein [Bacteroidales bacterium]
MASNPNLVQYIVDQCGGESLISVRKMFGDYGIYRQGKIFGLISDNGLYIKPTEQARLLLRSEVMRPPYEGAKPYFYIEEVDDREYLTALAKITTDSLPDSKSKSKSK